MSYPFCKATTWQQLIDNLDERGINYVETYEDLPPAWDGNQGPMQYFEKDGDGFIAVTIADKGDFVAFSVLRSICSVFDVNPSEFGMDLG